ncbi:hypothetical protein K1T71_002970 [Dendrolimus kikuchii]|uniref:Uncharacterized protein n=1 Tax=Dendrolimus kikuchii TaxID=765133 RepID=A0ACC1DAJ9_9NEOP|nr:hypothetical protein K1T71_002970 [Dendrolimus kikuchii]
MGHTKPYLLGNNMKVVVGDSSFEDEIKKLLKLVENIILNRTDEQLYCSIENIYRENFYVGRYGQILNY